MKSKVCCVILLCLIGAPALGQTPHVIDCEENAACVALVDQAQRQSKAGQLAEAEKSYKLAYEVSHDARLLFNIARVLDKRGQGPEAIKYYRLFIEAPLEEPEQKARAREYVAEFEGKIVPRQPRPLVPAVRAPTPSSSPTTLPATLVPVPATNSPQSVTPKTEGTDKPVYKKGWFWGVVIGSVAAAGLGIGLGVGLGSQGPTVPSGTNTIGPTF